MIKHGLRFKVTILKVYNFTIKVILREKKSMKVLQAAKYLEMHYEDQGT